MRFLLVAITAGLLLVTSASAMTGRFDSTGKIGKTMVAVGGPLSLDPGDAGAVVHATVTQGSSTAAGDSNYVPAGAQNWKACADTSDSFHAGPAQASATATVYEKDGSTRTLSWSQTITLK